MSINFPDSPSVNQLFSVGDRTWEWSGTTWNTVEEITSGPTGPTGPTGLAGTDGFSAITVSTTGPTGGTDGDLWIVYS
jgi:hypothetical protein